MPKRSYFPFGHFNKGVGGSLPKISDGSDGDLVILNGQTVQITAGGIYSYNSIDIQAGGVLEIVGIESAVTQVACRNYFICNGTFRGKYTEVAVGNISLPSDNWLGLSFSHSQSQSNGGWGGCGYNASKSNIAGNYITELGGIYSDIGNSWQGVGGNQFQGNGGGGGAGNSNDALNDPQLPFNSYSISGTGGRQYTSAEETTCQLRTIASQNGFAGSLNGFDGGYSSDVGANQSIDGGAFGGTGGIFGNGGVAYADGTTSPVRTLAQLRTIFKGANGAIAGGGAPVFEFKSSFATVGYPGGAGGSRGEHGRRVFILAEEGISGSGTIDFSGNAGYNATQTYSLAPGSSGSILNQIALVGGGGGGGAGGSGGAVWIRHFGTSTVTPTILSSGGSGGLRSRFNSQFTLAPEHPFGFSYGLRGNGTLAGPCGIGFVPQNGNGGGAGIIDVQAY
jgi:hypothetical protein